MMITVKFELYFFSTYILLIILFDCNNSLFFLLYIFIYIYILKESIFIFFSIFKYKYI
ncbi:hypothetical protein H8356DRAFT_1706644 [Neocallimastix lanati (nom. inval.)]|nr:hypothetical protein H8356DRAFT_1706644 [Neocallimastix sp. JGI-2020a]